ncbi:hypothetical protein FCM35_KLT20276 [Carex littledalei]|uniref:Uncharacterized protein n=1 Tax=Carex littledalei TaxID=544730 RepID=A0A833R5T7_9POAL|nr:hypothetical protein FCM35_KLT20276 [Carex littledalei]
MYNYIKGSCTLVIEQLINELTQLTKFFDMEITNLAISSCFGLMEFADGSIIASSQLPPWPMVTTDKALNPSYTVVQHVAIREICHVSGSSELWQSLHQLQSTTCGNL